MFLRVNFSTSCVVVFTILFLLNRMYFIIFQHTALFFPTRYGRIKFWFPFWTSLPDTENRIWLTGQETGKPDPAGFTPDTQAGKPDPTGRTENRFSSSSVSSLADGSCSARRIWYFQIRSGRNQFSGFRSRWPDAVLWYSQILSGIFGYGWIRFPWLQIRFLVSGTSCRARVVGHKLSGMRCCRERLIGPVFQ